MLQDSENNFWGNAARQKTISESRNKNAIVIIRFRLICKKYKRNRYPFLIEIEPNGIRFGAESIGAVWLQSFFGLI